MIQCKSAILLFAAGLAFSTGRLCADDTIPVPQTPTTPTTKAAVASKEAKTESPAVSPMKAALALAEAGKTDEAVAAFEKMGVQKTKRVEAWRLNNEGLAYLIADKPEKALPLLEKAVAANADNYVALNNLGIAYEQTGALEKAKDAYQKSIDAAKTADATSAKAEDNLKNLQARLDKIAAKKEKAAKKAGAKSPATPVKSTPAAGGDEKK